MAFVIMNTVFILGFAILAISRHSVLAQLYDGDSCVIKRTNANGVCKFLSKCPSAMADIKKGVFPPSCGFEGNEIIVCCQQDTPTLSARNPGELADKMCKSYSQYVWSIELNPTLIADGKDIKRWECPFNRQQLVVGGKPASRREFPHMVQLGYEGQPITWACGGTLISDQHVLTAAHCLEDRSLGVVLYARMGMVDLDDPEHVQQLNVSERIAYPEYEEPSHYHDIGIVKLQQKARLNTWVRPACLYTSEKSPWTNVIASGWGKTDFAGYESTVLLRVILELYDEAKCNKVYKRESGTAKLRDGIKDELMVCAGHSTDLKDTCQGDSGGPLQVYRSVEGQNTSCMYDVIGVTSFGKGCGLAVNIPGVYTRVSRYIKWIEDQVWPTN